MATVIYCFSKFKSTVREIETLCSFDLRVMSLLKQHIPNHAIIGKFINNALCQLKFRMFDILVLALIKANKLKHKNLTSNIVERPIMELALTL